MRNAWIYGEEPLVDEQQFTAWAEPGWLAWNPYSPELRFCEAAAELTAVTGGVKIETGAGQGYVTRRAAVGDYWVYESDPEMRKVIPDSYTVVESPAPSALVMQECSLLIADSAIEHRLREIRLWWDHAPADSLLLMHDAGNGHEGRGMSYTHNQHWKLLTDLGIPGIRYKNPRGSFLGWKQEPDNLSFLLTLLPVDSTR